MPITKERLAETARKASEKAYVPYSHFPVGAAFLVADDEVVSGCNIENASFGLSNCAERTAIFKAISEGKTAFKALAVYGKTAEPISPCGACRQVLAEFCPQEMPVYLVAEDMTMMETTVGDLLPYSFRELK